MSPASTTDNLLARLTSEEENRRKAPRGATPREGTVVTVWRLPGTWAVWSQGPTAGTWWLQAQDDEAARIADLVAENPSRAESVVTATWKRCIAVRARDIRTRTPANR